MNQESLIETLRKAQALLQELQRSLPDRKLDSLEELELLSLRKLMFMLLDDPRI